MEPSVLVNSYEISDFNQAGVVQITGLMDRDLSAKVSEGVCDTEPHIVELGEDARNCARRTFKKEARTASIGPHNDLDKPYRSAYELAVLRITIQCELTLDDTLFVGLLVPPMSLLRHFLRSLFQKVKVSEHRDA